MMTREELEAALDFWQRPENSRELEPDELMICAAARKQLALMPEKCGTCGGTGRLHEVHDDGGWSGYTCPTCHGSGKVYPPETVEKIAEAIDSISDEVWGYRGRQAVAVLDALGGKDDE